MEQKLKSRITCLGICFLTLNIPSCCLIFGRMYQLRYTKARKSIQISNNYHLSKKQSYLAIVFLTRHSLIICKDYFYFFEKKILEQNVSKLVFTLTKQNVRGCLKSGVVQNVCSMQTNKIGFCSAVDRLHCLEFIFYKKQQQYVQYSLCKIGMGLHQHSDFGVRMVFESVLSKHLKR